MPMPTLKALLTGGPQPVWLRYLLLIAAASGIMRFALGTQWMRESAVLYVLIPYLLGVVIYVAKPTIPKTGYWGRFGRHMRTATIVMLSTSLLLFEGFLCVVLFFPIYLMFAMVAAMSGGRSDTGTEAAHRTLKASVVPVLILVLSMDGIRGTDIAFGPDRDATVNRTVTLDLTPAQIRANIIDHAYPNTGRSRFLALFPRPVAVDATSVAVGARHTAHMEYRRWGVPGLNVHTGTTVMEFTEATATRLHARFVHDDSYLSHYMAFRTWALDIQPRIDGRTDVTLTVGYERLLAPSWYFGPLQRRAVGDGLDYALGQIIGGAAT